MTVKDIFYAGDDAEFIEMAMRDFGYTQNELMWMGIGTLKNIYARPFLKAWTGTTESAASVLLALVTNASVRDAVAQASKFSLVGDQLFRAHRGHDHEAHSEKISAGLEKLQRNQQEWNR